MELLYGIVIWNCYMAPSFHRHEAYLTLRVPFLILGPLGLSNKRCHKSLVSLQCLPCALSVHNNSKGQFYNTKDKLSIFTKLL
jgi:hypothetical protein